jgi:diguanylate cyclase (GGDEF)-like protein
MSHDGFEQLSVVAGLSQQKDGLNLTRSMISNLSELAPGVEVGVLEVYGRRQLKGGGRGVDLSAISIRRFDHSGQRANDAERHDLLHDAIRTLRPCQIKRGDGGGLRLVIPLWGDVGPLRLVLLDGLDDDPWTRAKIMQVVEIYGNLVRMMDSRERDPLTGLLNRQTFVALFELAKSRARAITGARLSLAVLDIDFFKRINDGFGHLYGDEVLIHFARLMEKSFRYTDDLFRFGGEEFVILLASERADGAREALERFRQGVESYEFPGVGRVTVSIGFVACRDNTLPTTLVDEADRALYRAKQTGRNRVVDYAELEDVAAECSGDIDLF